MGRKSYWDFEAINNEGLRRAESLLPEVVPKGKFEGDEYVALNPRRVDRHIGSFRFNIKTGKWADFATDDRGYGVISFVAFVRNIAPKQAAQELADRLGIKPGEKPPGRRATPPEFKGDGDEWVPVLPVPVDQGVPEKILKQFDNHYAYRDQNGNLLGFALRKNKKDGKDFFPLTFCRNTQTGKCGWRHKAFPAPRPLFGLNKLAETASGKVMVAEGEKTALAAQQLFPDFAAVTSYGGAKAAHTADWSPLLGKEVILALDQDEAGTQYGKSVANQLFKIGVKNISRLLWPKERLFKNGQRCEAPFELCQKGYDLADAVADGWTARHINHWRSPGVVNRIPIFAEVRRSKISVASPGSELRPLRRKLAAAADYPTEALPPVLRVAADTIQKIVQAPAAICAHSVLAVATLAVQGYADVELPNIGSRPISEFFISIANSGERKSTCDRMAAKAVQEHEDLLRADYTKAVQKYHDALEVWKKDRQGVMKNKKAYPDNKARKQALQKLGTEPDYPLHPMITCSEPTLEGLIKLLRQGQPSIGLFTDEGGQFIGGHAMSEDARLRTAAGMSKLWDGAPIDRVRATDEAYVVAGKRFAAHLMVQPEVAAEFISDPYLIGQGLLSRFLVAYPDSRMGKRKTVSEVIQAKILLKAFHDRVLDLLQGKLPLRRDTQNELDPPSLPLSKEGATRWLEFVEETERNIGFEQAWEPIRALAAKLPEHAARLAAVFTLFEDLEAKEVPLAYMEAGIRLVHYYANESLRMAAALLDDPDIQLAERLLHWAQKNYHDRLLPLVDIYQLGPGPIRKADTARKICGILVAHGWLRPILGGAEVDGVPRSEVFEVAEF